MDQAGEMLRQNSSWIGIAAVVIVLLAILYAVYTYMYPGADPTFTRFLGGEADARQPVVVKGNVPAIYTGGDFTLSFWVYVDDWNYKAADEKFLFAISPVTLGPTSRSPLVGVLTAMKNNMRIAASTVNARHGSSGPSSSAGPDITRESNLQNLLTHKTSFEMFQSTVGPSTDSNSCDVTEIPLQRWACVTIVSSGRVLDVYIDGKLQRSCVLDNVVHVPRGQLKLRLGENGGFGGRYSSVQMWSQQLTPDVIYGIYQMGPTQARHDIITDVTKYLNLNVSFTGSAPGQPIPGGAGGAQPSNPFAALSSDLSSAYQSATADFTSAEASAKNMLSRF
jgi:hypothetical protein